MERGNLRIDYTPSQMVSTRLEDVDRVVLRRHQRVRVDVRRELRVVQDVREGHHLRFENNTHEHN